MNRLIGVVAALLFSSFVVAEEDAYSIQCTILDGERVMGSPAVVAEPGKQVRVFVTDTYDLALTAEDQDDARIALSAAITIDGATHSPALLLELDRPAEIQIGDITFRVIVSRYVADDV
jgi:hypothetical protein